MPWRTRSSYTEDPDRTTTTSALSGSARTTRKRARSGATKGSASTKVAAAMVTRSARRRLRVDMSGRQPRRERADDSFGRVTVPQFRNTRRECGVRHDVVDGFADAPRIQADHAVGAVRDRDRTLGVLPECQTWHAKDGCFFLDPAGVGQ